MNYVTEVADYFLSKVPSTPILTAADYFLISEWEKQKIPIDIIQTTINEVFEKTKEDEISIDSICDFNDIIGKKFKIWLQTRDGQFY